ncbi:MAG TPA: hypothetical protein VGN57_17845 [Pirellulaceae bacterium]|jgi:hypothetical protein|nr:hypothetical protein [Pirellulaceae bacterium]
MNDLLVAIAYVAVLACAGCFLSKIWFDFMLAYAVVAKAGRGGVSGFPLVELLPLGLAVATAWAAGLEGWFSPASLGIMGLGLMGATFAHLFLVCGVCGLLLHLRKRRDDAQA